MLTVSGNAQNCWYYVVILLYHILLVAESKSINVFSKSNEQNITIHAALNQLNEFQQNNVCFTNKENVPPACIFKCLRMTCLAIWVDDTNKQCKFLTYDSIQLTYQYNPLEEKRIVKNKEDERLWINKKTLNDLHQNLKLIYSIETQINVKFWDTYYNNESTWTNNSTELVYSTKLMEEGNTFPASSLPRLYRYVQLDNLGDWIKYTKSSKIHYVLYKNNQVVFRITFKINENTNKTNWFSLDNYESSYPYSLNTNLATNYVFFSTDGYAVDPNSERRLYICLVAYTGCPNDEAVTAIFDTPSSDGCQYTYFNGSIHQPPFIYYALNSSNTQVNPINMESADQIAIWLQ